MSLTSTIRIGTQLHFDGKTWTVEGFEGGQIRIRDSYGMLALSDLGRLANAEWFKVLDEHESDDAEGIATFLDDVPEIEIEKAKKMLQHLNETECGFKSGIKATALPHEPCIQYDPNETTLNARMEAKANELSMTSRTLWNLRKAYLRSGLYGLVDQRLLRKGQGKNYPHITKALTSVLADLRDQSNTTRKRIIMRTKALLAVQYPDPPIKLPSKATFYRILENITKGTGAFDSAKSRRSIANRPQDTYRTMEVARPGEVVLVDSTPLDAFALDPVSFKWIQLQLTLALDLYTRSIVGWRFTPVSTKGVDAALLLYDIIRPKLMQKGWPAALRWAYLGVPASIVIELSDEDSEYGIAGVPLLNPETVVVDHGKVFISQAFKDGCKRLGINLQLARPYTPTDKEHVERVFRRIREDFVEGLPGYKGPDLFSRGWNVEADAFYFLDEIDAKFACWVAGPYQRLPHDGLFIPGVPTIKVSPNDMYNEGLARAGFCPVVSSNLLYYELLPTEWRTVQHYGIGLRGLRYNGDILEDYCNKTSPYHGLHAGKWPIRYDPRDLSRIFFFDDYTQAWCEIPWTHATGEDRPFNEATLSYAKSLVISRGGNPNGIEELAETLNALIDRLTTPSDHEKRERRLAAINAMHAQQVQKDRPSRQKQYTEPDAEVPLFADGSIQGNRLGLADSHDKEARDAIPLKTIDEAMEDDDDALDY